ncbi:response regulator [Ramlibacter ginsenosidimutans]|jgi:twitching motility two-component system response regulator PilH|uniref:Response regulator n=1 Tax=Ramlibacter ginsenosidimutans TaxID=502333 RepID=A0A934TW51_9BURK|nr:response regulator [Ramlibacter ginsenosidimutans]MBK6008699.1 response regulator [Ramlibacter ginsenosidimutans]
MTRHILIVEDSQIDRSRLEKVLAASGFQVSLAENGEQALAAVKRARPDAILMDVNMPGMDGFAATRALRGDAETKDIPVVLVTAKDQKADKAWGQMLGAKGYITKPYTDEQILSQVRAL